MINKITFNIQVELDGLSNKEYLLIKKLFIENITNEDLNKTITLKELDNIIHLSERRFKTNSMEFPDYAPSELEIYETIINIIG